MCMFNTILRTLGYVRVYDIQSGADLTIMYYLLKNVNKFGPGIGIDITYPKLGVCRYVGNRYTKYICYDSKLLEVDVITTSFSAKNYHDIKKIEIITKSKNSDKIVRHVDVTKAKVNFFDSNYFAEISKKSLQRLEHNTTELENCILENSDVTPMRFTEIFDIVKFYQTVNYPVGIVDNKSDEDRTIVVTREKFDDDLLEFITTYEELSLNN